MKNSAFLFALSLTFATFGVQTAVADVVYDDNVQGKEHAIGVILAWSTAVETNNMQFVVERSEDGGKTYAAVGTVKGAGNSTTRRNYNFLDAQASAANKVSYRLRQFDLDGTTNLSDVFTMTRKVQNLFTVVKMSPEGVAKAYNFTIDASYDEKQRDFIDFVLTQYIGEGVGELAVGKLPDLIELKYQSTHDAVQVLGSVQNIRQVFIGFQERLYAPPPDERV